MDVPKVLSERMNVKPNKHNFLQSNWKFSQGRFMSEVELKSYGYPSVH